MYCRQAVNACIHTDVRVKPAYAASAPETISMSWVVIIACRCLLNLRDSCFFSSLALSLALFMAFMRAASSDASASCSTLAHYQVYIGVDGAELHGKGTRLYRQYD